MVSLHSYLSRARDALAGAWWLAIVPFTVALLSAEKFTRLGTTDVHIGISFSLPFPVTGGWAFLNLPEADATSVGAAGIETIVTQFGLASLGFVLVSMVATAALTAGYLGTIHRVLTGDRPRFIEDTRRYIAPMLGFQLLILLAVLVTLLFSVIVPLFLLVFAVGFLAGGYFF